MRFKLSYLINYLSKFAHQFAHQFYSREEALVELGLPLDTTNEDSIKKAYLKKNV